MFKHILVPIDGSETSRKAAELAGRIALAEKSRVTLLAVAEYEHAIAESFFFPFFTAPVIFPVHEEKNRRELLEGYRRGLEKLRADVFDPSLEVEFEARIGHPAADIVQFAKTSGADLIVVGACGLGAIGDMLLGSVSDRVAHTAPCPVLIAR